MQTDSTALNEQPLNTKNQNQSYQQKSYYRPHNPKGPFMALNCIVDDAALLAGIRDNPKDNLKRWIADGHINLFVPLYTLERLNQLRSSPPPINLDARKTLEWLDQITSATESNRTGRVQLQGPDDQYQSWEEVERYLLPETPLSRLNEHEGIDQVSAALDGQLYVTDDGRASAPSENGPETLKDSSAKSNINSHSRNSSATAGNGIANIPERIRPLLNFVVWRAHHTDDSLDGGGKYVLLTTDIPTLKQAQKFGVRAKTLNQVRTVVMREGKRMSRGSPSNSPRSGFRTVGRDIPPTLPQEPGEDEDEVVFNPSKRPGSSRGAQNSPDVWDPDHFGRSPNSGTRGGASVPTGPSSNRGARGSSTSRGGRGNARGRGPPPAGRAAPTQVATPIDPDSYARPPPARGRGGRGGFGGRLWNPNT